MNHLVGSLVLKGQEKVIITWSNKTTEKAVYTMTYGYTHVFLKDNGGEIKLSNRFMQLKGIKIALDNR